MVDHARDATLDRPSGDDGGTKESGPQLRDELASLPEIAVGTSIGGRYDVVRRLGEGGMGAVYEAEHRAIQRRVAVKVLHSEYGRNPSVVERFLQEARAVNAVRHRNVVEVMDFGVDAGRPWLVMELLVGESLAARMTREGACDPAWAVRVLDPLCRALHQAHQRGFIHRDVKPDNVFLVREPEGEEVPKLLDFGIAKNLVEDRKLTATGAMVGTPAYMAPEQITDPRAVTHACDQYSVGAMLYEMLTGRLPFEAETFHGIVVGKVQGQCVPITDRRADLPPALASLVMRSLSLKPEDRFPDIEAFRLALHASLGGSPALALTSPSVPSPAPPVAPSPAPEDIEPVLARAPSSRRWVVALVAALALAAVVAVALRSRSSPPVVASPPRTVVTRPTPPPAAEPPVAEPTPPVVAPPVAPVAVAPAEPPSVPPSMLPAEPAAPTPHGRHHPHAGAGRHRPHGDRLHIDNHNPLR